MPNNSATGGPLQPTAVSPPIEGQALNRFFQAFLVGLSALDGTMVRPSFQTEPPDVPDKGECWMAFRYSDQPSDTYPYVKHDSTGDGSDQLQRHENINILCSFYDTGTNGLADATMKLVRDGLAIAQNREYLVTQGMAFISCGSPVTVPSLLKTQWLYRVDLPLVIRRAVVRTYPVLNVLEADGNIYTDVGYGPLPIKVGATKP
jgi:hypothetical protein